MVFHKGDKIEIEYDLTENIECLGGELTPELVIKNAVVIDSRGAFKADIEIANGRIIGLGRSAGRSCRHIDAEGLVLTAGGIYVSEFHDMPDADELLFSGYSTLIIKNITQLSGSKQAASLLESPLNVGFIASAVQADKLRINHLLSDGAFSVDICAPKTDPVSNSTDAFHLYALKRADDLRREPCQNSSAHHLQDLNTAKQYGLEDHIGSVSEGKLADLFMWEPEKFLRSPALIIKGGRLIFDSRISDRRDIIYTKLFDIDRRPAGLPCAFFTSKNAADGYIGTMVGQYRDVLVV